MPPNPEVLATDALFDRPPYRLRVSPDIWARHPDYVAFVVYARNLTNGPSNEGSSGSLRAAEHAAREAFGPIQPAEHEHIAAWRRAFQTFGCNGNRYPCSVEALLRRTLKGQAIPSINRLVDAYNAVSVQYVLPVGGEDWDTLDGDLVLGPASGEELFDVPDAAGATFSRPASGEIVWCDRRGVTCRRWNWRQSRRTRLEAATRNAYFCLDRLAPYPVERLLAAADALITVLQEQSPGANLEQRLISSEGEIAR